MPPVPNPAMWFAAFDYVRLTSKAGSDDEALKALYGKTVRAALRSGEGEIPTFKPWSWYGYYGESCPHGAYGAGAQGTILQVSGAQAQAVREMNPPYHNVARLDVQCTLWFERDEPDVGLKCARWSAAHRASVHGARWAIRHMDGYGKGDTCYLGSRGGDVFIRVYDKWRESGQDDAYRYAWRFEVELGGAPANEVWAGAHSSAPGPEAVAGWVRWYLARWGVQLPGTVSGILATIPPRVTRETDNERRLAWLRNQVAPSLDKMLASGVPLDRVMEALGLSDRNQREVG